MNPVEKIGLKWAKTISTAYVTWAAQEQKSKEIKIQPFDPSPLIEGAFYAAGTSQLDELGKLIGMGVKFDLHSKEAEAWISQFSASEIKYIDAANKQAIRQIKLRAFQEGLSLSEQRKLIKQHIGLLPQHVTAVNTYREGLLATGADAETANVLSARYARKLLNYRANMIGITEGMTASNEGTRTANEDAVKRGVLDPDEYEQEWRASGLPRTCDRCMAANGTRAPIGGEFPNGTRGPPIHQHDRCGVVIVRK